MTYKETMETMLQLLEKDRNFLLNASIATEVYDNITSIELTDEEFEELCTLIRKTCFDCCSDKHVDLSELCYVINDMLKRGKFEKPDEDCVLAAWLYSTYTFD